MNYTLVTGASGGIGYEIAKIFAQNGHNLILVARNEKKLNSVKIKFEKEYDVKVVVIAKNLAEKDAAKKIYDITHEKNYRIDNLVNNAGIGDLSAFLESDWEKQYNMVQLNITSLMQMSYLYGNDMLKQGNGHILNLSSVAAFGAGAYMSVYYASKAYILSFSEALSEELKNTGVTVTALCPGPTKTGFDREANMENARMFHAFGADKAEDVALCGYKAMQRGRSVAYYGKVTHIYSFLSRLLPRRETRKLAKWMNGGSKQK